LIKLLQNKQGCNFFASPCRAVPFDWWHKCKRSPTKHQ